MTALSTRNDKSDLNALLNKDAEEERASRRKKRQDQHERWMRVMMEGQSTPDLSYQKADA